MGILSSKMQKLLELHKVVCANFYGLLYGYVSKQGIVVDHKLPQQNERNLYCEFIFYQRF